jgi:voltage-gated sodium channel
MPHARQGMPVDALNISQQQQQTTSTTATEPYVGGAPAPGSLAAQCRRIAEAPAFQFSILAVIALNAVILGLETSPVLVASFGGAFAWFSYVVQAIFTVEILIRLTAYAPRPQRFFRDGWNNFDFVVVAIAFIPATGGLSNLARLARLLRVTRLVSVVPELRLIFETLVRSIPSIAYIVMLLSVFGYVYAVAGHQLFGVSDPDHWGSLGTSLITLFQVLTLEDWHEVYAAVLDAHPWSWAFFISFIVIAVMVVANLAVAVIINSLESAKQAEARRTAPITAAAPALERLADIREALAVLEEELKADAGGEDPRH